MTLRELKEIITATSEQALAAYQQSQKPAADMISQREAFDSFHEQRVRRWIEAGLIRPERIGPHRNSKRMFSRAELLALDAAERIKPIINRRRIVRMGDEDDE